jgi:hypothetical protein
VPQDRELPVQVVRGQALAYRFAYARSADTRASGDIGQDYLAVREGPQTFAFALCDGVSQSFYGDLAARYLGDALAAWLGERLPPAMVPETVRTALTTHLQGMTGPATEVVQRYPLPRDIPPVLRDVLEEKRTLGSESTFVCGRIDLPGADFPAGRIVLAWMGDSRLRLWMDDDARAASLGGVFETAQRWSSRRGLVGGTLNVYVAPLQATGQRVSRLMTYSDGLAALDTWKEDPSNHAVQNLIARAGEAATSDDISFLEVWLGPVPAHIEAVPLPVPLLLEVALREGRIRAAWRPVPGAQRYQVEVRDGEVRTWDVTGTDWESLEMPPGEYRLRVRAWRDEVPGEWSEERQVSVPPLPKPVSALRKWRLGCVAAMLALLVLAGVLAILTLPVNGPLHKFIFVPTPIPTPTGMESPIVTPALSPTNALSPIATPIPPVTDTPMPTPIPSPTETSTYTPTVTSKSTLVMTYTPTSSPVVTGTSTSSPPTEEPTPTETLTP